VQEGDDLMTRRDLCGIITLRNRNQNLALRQHCHFWVLDFKHSTIADVNAKGGKRLSPEQGPNFLRAHQTPPNLDTNSSKWSAVERVPNLLSMHRKTSAFQNIKFLRVLHSPNVFPLSGPLAEVPPPSFA